MLPPLAYWWRSSSAEPAGSVDAILGLAARPSLEGLPSPPVASDSPVGVSVAASAGAIPGPAGGVLAGVGLTTGTRLESGPSSPAGSADALLALAALARAEAAGASASAALALSAEATFGPGPDSPGPASASGVGVAAASTIAAGEPPAGEILAAVLEWLASAPAASGLAAVGEGPADADALPHAAAQLIDEQTKLDARRRELAETRIQIRFSASTLAGAMDAHRRATLGPGGLLDSARDLRLAGRGRVLAAIPGEKVVDEPSTLPGPPGSPAPARVRSVSQDVAFVWSRRYDRS